MSALDTLFGRPWHELNVESLGAFLEHAEPEPLLWEAKSGGTVHNDSVRKQAAGFGNSDAGGYLLLGVKQDKEAKSFFIDGWEVPGGEANTWVSTCLQAGPFPSPRHHIWTFEAAPGRVVCVVRFEPVRIGPCVHKGVVYERRSGLTAPIEDPTRLHELYQRARTAHQQASAAAQRLDPWTRDRLGVNRELRLHIALAPLVPGDDLDTRLFRVSTRDEIKERIRERLSESGTAASFHLDANKSVVGSDFRGQVATYNDAAYLPDWVLGAFTNGAVAIATVQDSGSSIGHIAEDTIRFAWRTATGLLEFLNGSSCEGYAHIQVELQSRALEFNETFGPMLLTDDTLDRDLLGRRLHRAAGIDAPEPEESA